MVRTILSLIVAGAALAACGGGGHAGRETRSARLDAIARAAVDQGFPGLAIAASPERGFVETGAGGFADRATGTPMTPDALIHAASTTKAFTAAAALLLIDRGALSLDATLPEVLPAEVTALVPHNERISVRHLLLHTSGIYSPNNDAKYLARYIGAERNEKPFWTAREIVAFASDPANPPLFEPGEGQAYGDINYVLLGLIVAATSGRPFKEYVRAEIFEPLGMADTRFLSDDPGAPRARGYTLDSEIVRSVGLDPGLQADATGLVDTTGAQEQSDAAAGIITTTPDLVRFADAFLRGNLLSDRSKDFVLAVAQAAQADGAALGVLRAYRKPFGLIVAAEGDGPGTHVVWAMDVNTDRIVAAATNLFGRWDENDYLMDVVLPAALVEDTSTRR